MDCGNGTFPLLQEHVDPGDLNAVVITHEHPDHCADIYGLHVLLRYGLEQAGLPVFAPEGAEERLGVPRRELGRHVRVERDRRRRQGPGRRDRPRGSPAPTTRHPPTRSRRPPAAGASSTPPTPARSGASTRSAPGADLVLSEASYLARQHPDRDPSLGAQAGRAAREAQAQRLDAHPHLAPGRPAGLGRGRIRGVRRAGHARRARTSSPRSDPPTRTTNGRESHGNPERRARARRAATDHVHARLHRARDGLGPRRDGPDPRAVHRVGRGAGAAVAARQGPGWVTAEYSMLPGIDARAGRP